MSTLIDRNTKKLMIAKKQKELEALFAEQESTKPRLQAPNMYAMGGLTMDKAKRMLADGTVRGKKLTDKQKAYFGLIAGGGQPRLRAPWGDTVPGTNKDNPYALENVSVSAYGSRPFNMPYSNGIQYPGLQPSTLRDDARNWDMGSYFDQGMSTDVNPPQGYNANAGDYQTRQGNSFGNTDMGVGPAPLAPYSAPQNDPYALPTDRYTSPIESYNGTGPQQYMNTGNPTQTPNNAFNFKDKLQVYGKEFLDKAKGFAPNAMQLAPAISNIIGGLGKPQTLNARDYYNPRRDQISNLMHNRRVDIQPTLNAISDSERTAQYNLRNTANSRGELMGNMTAASNNAMRSRAQAYMGKQNADLGYQGQEAESLMNLGQGEQQANWNTMDYNNQNIANKRNMWRAGLSQLGQYSQNKELMKNQFTQDQNKMSIFKDMFTATSPFMQFLKTMQMPKP